MINLLKLALKANLMKIPWLKIKMSPDEEEEHTPLLDLAATRLVKSLHSYANVNTFCYVVQ